MDGTQKKRKMKSSNLMSNVFQIFRVSAAVLVATLALTVSAATRTAGSHAELTTALNSASDGDSPWFGVDARCRAADERRVRGSGQR